MAGFYVPSTEILNFFLTSHIDFLLIFGQCGDNCKENLFLKRKVGVTEHPRSLNPSKAIAMAICPIIAHFKQLLDEVFVISRIIKVKVRVISRSRRLRLITLTQTLIILDITKTVACVASVSVGFGSKERPRNEVFGILSARKMGRELKKDRWG